MIEKHIERTFDNLFEELAQLFNTPAAAAISEIQTAEPTPSDKLAKVPVLATPMAPHLMDRLDKLSGDYDIQQEYSLSNLKESIFQL